MLITFILVTKDKNTNEYETSRLIGVRFAKILNFCDRMDFEVKNNYPLPLKEVQMYKALQ